MRQTCRVCTVQVVGRFYSYSRELRLVEVGHEYRHWRMRVVEPLDDENETVVIDEARRPFPRV